VTGATARATALAAAVLVGAVVAVQARVNGDLAVRLGGGLRGGLSAALVQFVVGGVVVTAIALVVPSVRRGVASLPRSVATGRLTWWQCIGGLGGAFLILSQAASVPVLGVAVFTVAVVGGQTGSGLVVDGVGLGPAGPQPVTVRRVVASLVTVGAVVLAVSGRLGVAGFSVPLVLVRVLAGGAVSVQSALNGRVNVATGSALAAGWLNFATGGVALGIAVLAMVASGHRPEPLPSEWWLYTGGLMGLAFVTVVAAVVRVVGVLLVTLATVAGQLLGAMLLDWWFPVGGEGLAATTVVGTLVTLGAVAFGSVRVPVRR
jgi:bacterial/archaeal transporter family-2 protein